MKLFMTLVKKVVKKRLKPVYNWKIKRLVELAIGLYSKIEEENLAKDEVTSKINEVLKTNFCEANVGVTEFDIRRVEFIVQEISPLPPPKSLQRSMSSHIKSP